MSQRRNAIRSDGRRLLLVLICITAAGCYESLTAYPPPAMTVADAHRLPRGAVELQVAATADVGYLVGFHHDLTGIDGAGIHVGLPLGTDMTLHLGEEWEGLTGNLQLGGHLFTTRKWSGDWIAGSGATYNWDHGNGPPACVGPKGHECSVTERGYAYGSFAPNVGLRFNGELSPQWSLNGQFRFSYARTFNIAGLSALGIAHAYWIEPMVGVRWNPVHWFRAGLGLGALVEPEPVTSQVGLDFYGTISFAVEP